MDASAPQSIPITAPDNESLVTPIDSHFIHLQVQEDNMILSDPVLKRLDPHGLPIFGSVMPDKSNVVQAAAFANSMPVHFAPVIASSLPAAAPDRAPLVIYSEWKAADDRRLAGEQTPSDTVVLARAIADGVSISLPVFSADAAPDNVPAVTSSAGSDVVREPSVDDHLIHLQEQEDDIILNKFAASLETWKLALPYYIPPGGGAPVPGRDTEIAVNAAIACQITEMREMLAEKRAAKFPTMVARSLPFDPPLSPATLHTGIVDSGANEHTVNEVDNGEAHCIKRWTSAFSDVEDLPGFQMRDPGGVIHICEEGFRAIDLLLSLQGTAIAPPSTARKRRFSYELNYRRSKLKGLLVKAEAALEMNHSQEFDDYVIDVEVIDFDDDAIDVAVVPEPYDGPSDFEDEVENVAAYANEH